MTDPFKNALRNTMKQVRANLSATYQSNSSIQICSRIASLDQFQNAEHIAFYHAVHGEIDLSPLWHLACEQNKSCYFPLLKNKERLRFLPATPSTTFKKNKFGIPEPQVAEDLEIDINALDLILLPVVGFDIHCTRLGMGAGYYDRTLENKQNGTLFGVAYQFQRIDHINPEPWDVPLDAIITQKAIYWRSPPE